MSIDGPGAYLRSGGTEPLQNEPPINLRHPKPNAFLQHARRGQGSHRTGPIRQRTSPLGKFLQKFKRVLSGFGKMKYAKPALDLLAPDRSLSDLDRSSTNPPQAEMLRQMHGDQALKNLNDNKDLIKTNMGWRTPSSPSDRQNMRLITTALLLQGASREQVKGQVAVMRKALNANDDETRKGASRWLNGIANRFKRAYGQAAKSNRSTDRAIENYEKQVLLPRKNNNPLIENNESEMAKYRLNAYQPEAKTAISQLNSFNETYR